MQFVGLHCVITVSFLFSLCVITYTVVTLSFGSMKLMNKWLNEYMNRQTDIRRYVRVSVCTRARVCVCVYDVPETLTTLQIMTSHKTTD